ncbi:HipA N-terminal domain-containing protein [Enorma phocaeensis]|uniref:HipA N-terminal domain-containing protein n=1 Tax=Enorma phocaeensis TaxID=1871019 RepID=A0A921IXF1_9ACTN|nr:HipA N-terminal domain-containing protein [Enorma phocaeensis]
MSVLYTFREWESTYQLVGVVTFSQGELQFSYADSYLSSATARPISLSLPLH